MGKLTHPLSLGNCTYLLPCDPKFKKYPSFLSGCEGVGTIFCFLLVKVNFLHVRYSDSCANANLSRSKKFFSDAGFMLNDASD